MPLVAFSLKETEVCTVFDIQDHLKARGWIVPAYSCPKGAESLCIMRIVVKQNFTTDLANLLVRDLISAVHYFEQFPAYDSEIMKKRDIKDKEGKAGESDAGKTLWLRAIDTLRTKNEHRKKAEKTNG